MKLYDLVKDRLKDCEGVISDPEMVVVNRRDFLYSETSTARSFLRLFAADGVTYEMMAIIDFVHASVCKIRAPADVRVFQLSKSMTLPALAVSTFVGDQASSLRILAPRGVQKVDAYDAFALELAERFEQQLNSGLTLAEMGSDDTGVDILFCNASNEAEVSSGLKAFERVKRGFLLIKGYGRAKAPNCGDIILGARLNVHANLAGFGFCSAY